MKAWPALAKHMQKMMDGRCKQAHRTRSNGRRSGGVGIVAKCPMKTIPIAGASKDYQDAYEAGRAAIYACDLGAATLHISVI